MICLLFLALVASCQTSQSQQTQRNDDPESILNQDAEAEFVAPSDVITSDASGLAHPKAASAWNTKILVMTSVKPDESRLTACENEIHALAKLAKNSETMLLAVQKMTPEVQRNKQLYHWCFYNSMMKLDNKLMNDAFGVAYEAKVTGFQQSIKAEWLLAMALDRGHSRQTYYNYLQKRYLELSRDYFGRELDIYAPPMGRTVPRNVQFQKGAGEADVDF